MRAKYIKTTADLTEFHLKQIKFQNFLYEGLIKSYSVKDTIRYFDNNKVKKNIKDIKYSFVQSENNALPYILIEFVKTYSLDIAKEIISWFKLCGWELADVIDRNDISYKENINIKNIKYLVFRAKFDVEILRKDWPSALYHLAPLSKQNKILKNGLVPKAENKLLKHEDAVYMFAINNYSELEILSKMLSLKSKNKESEYSVYKIETALLPAAFILFVDPDLKNSYFTKDNISTNAFSLETSIKI